MGQFPSAPFGNTFGLVRYRTIQTKYANLTAVKIHPEGHLIAVANEQGSLALFDLSSKSDLPTQNRRLHYKYGGVSDLLWLTIDLLAVGTTRGQVVIFNLKNTHILEEVCVVNAHGDGISQVAVQAMDFSAKARMLVTVGQGVNCIRLWQVGDDGKLLLRDIASPVMYLEPRFVAFTQTGILVGYFENTLFQNYTLDLVLVEERVLGQTGHQTNMNEDRQMANAIFLEELDTLAVLNLCDGIETFDPSKLIPKGKSIFKVNPYCSQGMSSLRQGTYLISSAMNGFINVYKSGEMTRVAQYKMSCNEIQALHSLNHPRFEEDLVVSLSCKNGKPSALAVWGHKSGLKRHRLENEKLPLASVHGTDHSTMRIILLCASVYILCHVTHIFFVPILTSAPTHAKMPNIRSAHPLEVPMQSIVYVSPSNSAQTWVQAVPTVATAISATSFLNPVTSNTALTAAIGSCIPRSADHTLYDM